MKYGRVWAAGLAVCALMMPGLVCGDEPLPGPKYYNLRYEEDFSYLSGPEGSYEKDWWDAVKWIGLSDEWALSIGAQARLRFESETNKNFGATDPVHDAFMLQRYFVHMDVRGGEYLRFFLQGKFAHANDRQRGGLAGMEDHADFHQAFADVTAGIFESPVTFRLGRQELQYGAQRLISPLDWGNTRRTFDGVKAFTDTGNWHIDAFAVRPVLVDRRNLDDEDENVDFYGLYATQKSSSALNADYYMLLWKNNNLLANSNGNTGKQTLYTLGTRLWGAGGDWDYETEAAAQFGTFAGDRVRSWMATAGSGYTWRQKPWSPRLSLYYDYASGDSDPTDNTMSTFNQLYPLGHAYLGYLDLVGRRNVHAVKVQLAVLPTKKVSAWVDFHTFFADQDTDDLYSAAGTTLRNAPPGGAGSYKFGHELDITMKTALDRHTSALVGWAHMWPGGFVNNTGAADEPDFVYAQIEYKF